MNEMIALVVLVVAIVAALALLPLYDIYLYTIMKEPPTWWYKFLLSRSTIRIVETHQKDYSIVFRPRISLRWFPVATNIRTLESANGSYNDLMKQMNAYIERGVVATTIREDRIPPKKEEHDQCCY